MVTSALRNYKYFENSGIVVFCHPINSTRLFWMEGFFKIEACHDRQLYYVDQHAKQGGLQDTRITNKNSSINRSIQHEGGGMGCHRRVKIIA